MTTACEQEVPGDRRRRDGQGVNARGRSGRARSVDLLPLPPSSPPSLEVGTPFITVETVYNTGDAARTPPTRDLLELIRLNLTPSSALNCWYSSSNARTF